MRYYFKEHGITSNIFNMEMFDFLSSKIEKIEKNESSTYPEIRNKIVYAGGIGDPYRHFFYQDFPHKFSLDFYGPIYPKTEHGLLSNSTYHGVFTNEELTFILEGDYGLIWNDSALLPHTKFDEFWRIGTSSKLPLYITSGLPIICKKGTGDQKIIEKYNIGFAVLSLQEIDDVLSETSEEQYQIYKKNVAALMEKTKKGYFLKRAVDEILSVFMTK